MCIRDRFHRLQHGYQLHDAAVRKHYVNLVQRKTPDWPTPRDLVMRQQLANHVTAQPLRAENDQVFGIVDSFNVYDLHKMSNTGSVSIVPHLYTGIYNTQPLWLQAKIALCAILARFGPSACPSSQPFRLPSLACTRAPRKPRRRPSRSSIDALPEPAARERPSIQATPGLTHRDSPR